MDQEKLNRLADLVDDIKKVDAMIQLHSSNPSSVMREQYLAKKVKLTGYLIEELTSPGVRSLHSYSIIWEVLAKFYPDLKNEVAGSAKNQDLSELELLLAS